MSQGSARQAPLPAVIDPNRASASALGQARLDTVGRAAARAGGGAPRPPSWLLPILVPWQVSSMQFREFDPRHIPVPGRRPNESLCGQHPNPVSLLTRHNRRMHSKAKIRYPVSSTGVAASENLLSTPAGLSYNKYSVPARNDGGMRRASHQGSNEPLLFPNSPFAAVDSTGQTA